MGRTTADEAWRLRQHETVALAASRPQSILLTLLRPGVSRPIAAAVVCLTGLAMLAMSPGIGFDAAPGLLASEQRLSGRGNELTEIQVADPADLARDVSQTVAWWPPGQQIVTHALRVRGLSLEESLKLLAVASWIIGLAAWSFYQRSALVDQRLLPWTIAFTALLRLTHEGGFRYAGGETLLWGVVPLVVVMQVNAGERQGGMRVVSAAMAGCLATSLVVFKYSGAILALALGLAWIWSAGRTRAAWSSLFAWAVGAAAGLTLVVVTGTAPLVSGVNPLTSPRSHDAISVVAWGVFGPLEAMSDLAEAGTSVSKRVGGGPLSERAVGLLSLALGAWFLAWFVTVRRAGSTLDGSPPPGRTQAIRIAALVTLVTSAALIALRLAGSDISWESRHHQYSMFLVAPFLVEWLLAALRQPRRLLRALSAIGLVICVLVPAVYGALVLTRRAVAGPTGIDREWSREGPGASPPLAAFSGTPGFDRALVATISPRTALTFADHRILLVMALRPGEIATSPAATWRTQRFAGRPAGGVALVLPAGVAPLDTQTLLDSFVDVSAWTPIRLEGAPGAQLWMGR